MGVQDNATCSNSFGSFECACDAGFARLQEAVDESCDADWTEWEGSCFRPLFRENDNDRAESLCSDLGAHLPVVTSRVRGQSLPYVLCTVCARQMRGSEVEVCTGGRR